MSGGTRNKAVWRSRYDGEIHYHTGRGEFIGTEKQDCTERDDARKSYDAIINESPVQGGKAIWARVRYRWGKALTHDAALADYNPNHEPAGSGGQFAPAAGGAGGSTKSHEEKKAKYWPKIARWGDIVKAAGMVGSQ